MVEVSELAGLVSWSKMGQSDSDLTSQGEAKMRSAIGSADTRIGSLQQCGVELVDSDTAFPRP